MNWEIGIDMYTLMCMKWMINKNLMYKKKSLINSTNTTCFHTYTAPSALNAGPNLSWGWGNEGWLVAFGNNLPHG